MSWLFDQLSQKAHLNVKMLAGGVVSVETDAESYAIHVPGGYMVTVQAIQEAKSLDADTVCYASSWQEVSLEARAVAKQLNVRVMPYGELFGKLE